MSKDDGGYFFPKIEAGEFGKDVFLTTVKQGISRRDWLAGLAMQGYLTNPTKNNLDDETTATRAYQWADAMIKQGKE